MDCVLKTYNVDVNDNSLPFYNWLKVYIKAVTSPTDKSNGFRYYKDLYRNESPSGLKVVGDNLFFADSSLTSLGVKQSNNFYLYGIFFTNADGVLLINPAAKNLMSLAGAGTIKKAYYLNLDEMTETTSFEQIAIANSDSVGNIASLDKNLSLTTLTLGDTLCIGVVAELAEKMVANGRTSGTLAITSNGAIKLVDDIFINNGTPATITFSSSTAFSIVLGTSTYSFTKSGDVWSYTVSE